MAIKQYSRVIAGLSFDKFTDVYNFQAIYPSQILRWFDVGSWEGLWEAMSDGADGNATVGNVITIDAHGVIARGGSRLMVLMGVSDLVAIDTGDAILIARRSQSQEVRRVPEELARRGLTRYL